MADARRVLRSFGRLRGALGAALEGVGAGGTAEILPVRRAMQELVTMSPTSRGLQLALLESPRLRAELPGRLAATGVLAAQMALTADQSSGVARDVGVAAALGGVGRALHMASAHAAPDAIAQSSSFAGGARALLPRSGRGRHTALRIVAAVQQSSPSHRRGGHPVARLTAVACAYERLTHVPPIGAGSTGPRAIGALLAREDLDPDYVRLLARTVGVYPPGSLVRLDTGETAVVADVPADEAWDTPPVYLVADASGEPIQAAVLSLSDAGAHITGIVDAAGAGLNAASYLFRA